MTYKENVQRIAEEMAKARCKDGDMENWEDLSPSEKRGYKEASLIEARIAVAHIAKELRPCLEALATHALVDVNKILLERGLIPESDITETTNVEPSSNSMVVSPDNKNETIIEQIVLIELIAICRDGGTLLYGATNEKTYYMDGRIGTKTPGRLFTNYPGKEDAKEVFNFTMQIHKQYGKKEKP